jgi:hypothetical protein
MTLKKMNFISYIYISTLICVPLVDNTQNSFKKRTSLTQAIRRLNCDVIMVNVDWIVMS